MFSPPDSPRWYRVFAIAALIVSGGMFCWIGWSQLTYPGFAESMEGDILQHVARAAHGDTIYPAPNGEYIALAYMPLYYLLAAPFYLMCGDSLLGPRLLSVLCAVGSALLVGRIAARETGSTATGLLGAAFYCAGYRIMDGCLFCALPDSLLLFWLLLGYWFWAYGTTRLADLAWLTCFSLAFWTKQHGAFFFGGAVLYALLYRKNALPRWAILAGIALGGPVAYWIVSRLMDEHFVYHTLTVPGKWERSWWFAVRRTVFVLGSSAPLALAAGLDLTRRWWQRAERTPSPLGWFTVVSLASSLVTMTSAGGSNNHYAPLLAILSAVLAVRCYALLTLETSRLALPLFVVFPVSVAVTVAAFALYRNHPIPLLAPIAMGVAMLAFLATERSGMIPVRKRLLGVGVLIVCQFAICAYTPGKYLPPPGWREEIARLNAVLEGLDGPVVWLTYGHVPAEMLPRSAGNAPSWVALEDIDRQVGNKLQSDKVLAPFRDRIRASHGLYLLTDTRIDDEDRAVWRQLKEDVVLVKEFGDEFARVRQIAEHWYTIDGVPRYLYRVR